MHKLNPFRSSAGGGVLNCQSDSKALVSNLRLAAPLGCESAACKNQVSYDRECIERSALRRISVSLVKNGTGEEEDRLGFGGGS